MNLAITKLKCFLWRGHNKIVRHIYTPTSEWMYLVTNVPKTRVAKLNLENTLVTFVHLPGALLHICINPSKKHLIKRQFKFSNL